MSSIKMKGLSTPLKIVMVVIVLLIVVVIVLTIFSGGIGNVANTINKWLEGLFGPGGEIIYCDSPKIGGQCLPRGSVCQGSTPLNPCHSPDEICCKT